MSKLAGEDWSGRICAEYSDTLLVGERPTLESDGRRFFADAEKPTIST